jgi:hypothetical protein
MDPWNALRRTRKTMLAAMFPRPIFEKTVKTWVARVPKGDFSAAREDERGWSIKLAIG